jgi:hypothetical protein
VPSQWALAIGETELQVLVVGLYSSALDKRPAPLRPPATTTLPFGSVVAKARLRPVAMTEAELHESFVGSYSSALTR